MPRPNAIGVFRVEFDFIDRETRQPIESEYRTRIGLLPAVYEDREDGERVLVDAAPIVSNKQPYVGELTQHEYDWLTALPGTEFNLSYRFTVTPAK